MPTLEPVRPITLAEIRAARERIAGTIVRTPLVRLELGPGYPDIRLKLENLQPINAYKLRGAANAVAMLSDAERKRGVWTISAGNAGQGVAYAARTGGRAVHGRGDRDGAGREARAHAGARREARAGAVRRRRGRRSRSASYPGVEGTFVHPFDDHNFIAGHAHDGAGDPRGRARTRPPSSPASAAAGSSPASAARSRRSGPTIKIWGAEPETAAPAALSFASGIAAGVHGLASRRSSTAPAARASSRACGSACSRWSTATSSSASTRRSGRCGCMAEKARVIAEGAGALPLAAALTRQGRPGPDRRHRLRRQHRPRGNSPS